MKIYDISVPVSDTLHTYKGDPGVVIERRSDLDKGDPMTISHLNMGAHTGTHMDAPLHFVRGGETIDQLDLNLLIGPAQVVDLSQVAHAITARDLEAAHIPAGTERLLLKTRNDALWEKPGFQEDFVGLDVDAAQWVLDHRIKLIGIDYLSIECFGSSDHPVHHMLLGGRVVIVEGINLHDVQPGSYELICLPVKLANAEGAPARAVLIAR